MDKLKEAQRSKQSMKFMGYDFVDLKLQPRLSPVESALMWLVQKYKLNIFTSKEPGETLKEIISPQDKKKVLDFLGYSDENALYNDYDRFVEDYKIAFESEKKKLKELQSIQDKLDKARPTLKHTPFEINRESLEMNLITSKSTNVLQLFDAFVPSKITPYAMCYWDGKMYYKSYEQFPISDEWVFGLESESMLFYTLNVDKFNENNQDHINRIDDFFSQNIILPQENNLVFSFEYDLNENTRKEMIARSLSAFDEEISVVDVKQTEIHGDFIVEKLNVDRNIFTYLVNFNDIFKALLYVDETEEVSSLKKRYNLRYRFNDLFRTNTLNFSPVPEGTFVRFGRIKNEKEAKNTIANLMKLFQLYTQEFSKVKSKFTRYVPDFTAKPALKRVIVREEKKTGTKLDPLKEKYPGMFRDDYNRKCQLAQQPTITDSPGPGVIEVPYGTKQYFTCDNPLYKYPYVKKNRKLKSTKDLEYPKEVPYIPCCAQEDRGQYEKYVKSFTLTGVKTKSVKQDDKVKQTILNPTVLLDEERKGYLPPNMVRVLNSSGLVANGFLRHGVKKGGDSVLQCLENATDGENDISQIRQELLVGINLVRQNGVDEDYILNSPYLNPHLLIPLLEWYYKANIYIFDSDDIVIPHINYLVPPKVYNKSIILYTHYQQTELVYKKNKVINNPLDGLNELFEQRLMRWSVETLKAYNYPPFELIQKATGQVFDDMGHTRALLIDDVIIFTQPMFNLIIKEVQHDASKYTTDPLEFDLFEPKQQYVADGRCKGLIRDQLFVMCDGDVLDGVNIAQNYIPPNLYFERLHSRIEMDQSRRSAEFLKWASTTTQNNIVVDQNVDLNHISLIYPNDNDNTIRVNDLELKRRLELFRRVNAPLGYKLTLHVSDFKQRPNQIISINEIIPPEKHKRLISTMRNVDPTIETIYFVALEDDVVKIQNVADGDRDTAAYVAHQYNKNKVNEGFNASGSIIDEPNVVDEVNQELKEGVNIFEYPSSFGKNIYAAILLE